MSRGLIYLTLICGCFCLSCSDPVSKQKRAEAPPSSAATQPASEQPAPAQQSLPPELAKVQEAVKRVFKDSALLDTTRNPSFVAGDFNGDLSPDIAVVIKPAAGRLTEMNEEYPAWILKDPFKPNQPGTPRPVIAEDEILLAVIHGFGPAGWNDPQATQTFLLKNAAGLAMRAQAGKEFLAANHGKQLPRINGDLIGEVLRGSPGYLYYNNAAYSWYDQKTFKGAQQPELVHAGKKK